MKKLLTLVLGLAFTATAFGGEFADITVPELKKAIGVSHEWRELKHSSARPFIPRRA